MQETHSFKEERPSHINTYIHRERGVEEESGGYLFYESL
jgi:hypothetical protein